MHTYYYCDFENRIIGFATITLRWFLSVFYHMGLPTPLFFNQTCIIYYLIGAFIGLHYFDGFARKKPAFVSRVSGTMLTSFVNG